MVFMLDVYPFSTNVDCITYVYILCYNVLLTIYGIDNYCLFVIKCIFEKVNIKPTTTNVNKCSSIIVKIMGIKIIYE